MKKSEVILSMIILLLFTGSCSDRKVLPKFLHNTEWAPLNDYNYATIKFLPKSIYIESYGIGDTCDLIEVLKEENNYLEFLCLSRTTKRQFPLEHSNDLFRISWTNLDTLKFAMCMDYQINKKNCREELNKPDLMIRIDKNTRK